MDAFADSSAAQLMILVPHARREGPFARAPGARPAFGAGSVRARTYPQHVRVAADTQFTRPASGKSSGPRTTSLSAEPSIPEAAIAIGDAGDYMNAYPAVAQHTELVRRCVADRDRVVCNYNADAFEYLLDQYNLIDTHPTLIQYLRQGFPMARNPNIPIPSCTFLPKNHASATDTPEHRQFVADYLADEERQGRVSVAYPEDVIRECFGHV